MDFTEIIKLFFSRLESDIFILKNSSISVKREIITIDSIPKFDRSVLKSICSKSISGLDLIIFFEQTKLILSQKFSFFGNPIINSVYSKSSIQSKRLTIGWPIIFLYFSLRKKYFFGNSS